MTWTYDPSLEKAKDQVRFLLGDRYATTPLLADEEIDWLLDQEQQQLYPAAVRGCEAIIALLSQEADTSVAGDISTKQSQRRLAFAALLGTLRRRTLSLAHPWAGGISVADKASRAQDLGRTQPIFRRHEGDYPGTVLPAGLSGDHPDVEP